MTPIDELRREALAVYAAALAAVDPARALRRVLDAAPRPGGPVWIIALGKAAGAMARAAVEYLASQRVPLAGGLAVSTGADGPEPGIPLVAGDHPLPDTQSLTQAARLARLTASVRPDDDTWVLLSGGTSSLIAAPVPGISPADFRELHGLLFRAGLPIDRLNAIRKRFAQWGGGRLARALPSRTIRVFALSDVPGDAMADIGSGPCEPDPTRASDVRRMVQEAGLWPALPPSVREYLEHAIDGRVDETAKPSDPALLKVDSRVVAGNDTAVDAAEQEARALGFTVHRVPGQLTGEAREVGRMLGDRLAALMARGGRHALVGGGETTVTLGAAGGRGGRCQELALSAASRLEGLTGATGILLAAGTDGRDGPTDAAGAMVSPDTWPAIRRAGIDPVEALDQHDAYPALAAADALVRTGPTGTNVMDVAVGLAETDQSGGPAEAGR